MKQALTEALAAMDSAPHGTKVDPEPILAAARLVERLLPGRCEHGETTEHGAFRPGVPGSSWMCPGQVWDEGIVEAVAKAIHPWDDNKEIVRERGRAVLSALVELLTEKVET